MSSPLSDLYRDLVLDHGKRPRNCRRLDGAAAQAQRYNPRCGDEVTVYVDLADNVVREVAFQGMGCTLSTASASVMTEAVQGKSPREIAAIGDAFGALLIAGSALPSHMAPALAAFAGVRGFPSRVACALLPWRALRTALQLPE